MSSFKFTWFITIWNWNSKEIWTNQMKILRWIFFCKNLKTIRKFDEILITNIVTKINSLILVVFKTIIVRQNKSIIISTSFHSMFVKTMMITILLKLFQLWTWRRNVKRNTLFFINSKNKTLFIVRHNINQIINIVFNKINKHLKIKMNALNHTKINNSNFNSRHSNNNKTRQIRAFNSFDLIQILLKFHSKSMFHLNKKFISINKKRRIVNFEKLILRMKRMKTWFQVRKTTIKKKTKMRTLTRRKYLRQKTRITIKKTMKSKNLR